MRLAVAAALIAIVAFGAALRLAPARDPDGRWIGDAAFHDRMIRAVLARGAVPAVDSLSEAPAGRRVGDVLPVGLYAVAAGFDRVMAAFGVRDSRTATLWCVALAGALIAIPVYGAARALFADRWAALLAALIAVILPAHVHRTWCGWLRYEPLGTTLIMAHLAGAFGALTARTPRAARVLAAISGAWLFAAVWVWHVALLVPFIELAFVVCLAAVRAPERAVREWFTAVVIAETIAALTLGYQRHEAFAVSRGWLFTMATCAALWTPWLRRADAPRRARLAAVAVAAAIAIGVGAFGGHEREYSVMLRAIEAKIAGVTFMTAIDPLTALLLGVDELSGTAPGEWLSAGVLSWLGAWFVLLPALFWWRAGRPSPARLRDAGAAGMLYVALCVALVVVTALLTRAKVILAPLVAIGCGGSLLAILPAPAGEPAARPKRARAPRGNGIGARVILAGAFAACVIVTARDGIGLATTRRSHLDPGLVAALDYLRTHTAPDATVLSLWERGYEIQAYAERRTLVDAMLEAPVGQRRIVEIDRALMQSTTDSLAALCRRDGATWLLVPPSESLLGIALVTRPPFLDKLLPPGRPLNRQDADHVVIRMMVLGQSIAPFELAFEQRGYRVYRVAGAS